MKKLIFKNEKTLGAFIFIGATFLATLITAVLSVVSIKAAGLYAGLFAFVLLVMVIRSLVTTVKS